MKDEALRMALEVLNAAYVPIDLDEQREKAITAIKQALTAQQAVPDVLTRDDGESPEYTSGWNDCRQLMLEMLRGKP